jgi:hypothetical protein
MTSPRAEVVNVETGELVEVPTEAQVRASVKRVIDHAESIWDEWAWQVECRTWVVLGYADWDEMRRAEYGSLNRVSAPRAETPELVARFRTAGLTQTQTAETLGIGQKTVSRHDPSDNTGVGRPRVSQMTNAGIVDAELVEDEPTPKRAVRNQAQRDDAEVILNRLCSLAAQASREATTLTPAQITRVTQKADLWTVGLRESVETLQRLLTSLTEEK